MSLRKVWIYRLLFVFFVCTVTDFSAEDKASGVRFCRAVHWPPRQGISHYGELRSPRSPKIGRIGQRAKRDEYSSWWLHAVHGISRGVWTQDRHVWIEVSPHWRTCLTGITAKLIVRFCRLNFISVWHHSYVSLRFVVLFNV